MPFFSEGKKCVVQSTKVPLHFLQLIVSGSNCIGLPNTPLKGIVGCIWFISVVSSEATLLMEAWHGNVENKNKLVESEKHLLFTWRLRVPIWRVNFFPKLLTVSVLLCLSVIIECP